MKRTYVYRGEPVNMTITDDQRTIDVADVLIGDTIHRRDGSELTVANITTPDWDCYEFTDADGDSVLIADGNTVTVTRTRNPVDAVKEAALYAIGDLGSQLRTLRAQLSAAEREVSRLTQENGTLSVRAMEYEGELGELRATNEELWQRVRTAEAKLGRRGW